MTIHRLVGGVLAGILLAVVVLMGGLHTVTAQTGEVSLWPSTTPSTAVTSDSSVELGIKFKSDVAGQVTGLRYYRKSGMSSATSGSLWSASGALLARVTFSGTSTGWKVARFTTPVTIAANTVYVASYHAPSGYVGTNDYFTNGRDVAPLHAPASGSSGGNGVYRYGSTAAFPTQTWQASNYWVDVLFVPSGTPPPPPPPPPPSCTFTVSPSVITAVSGGTTSTVSVTASSSTCAWTDSSSAAWITIAPVSGTGTGTVTVTSAANTGAQRSGVLTVAEQTVTVTQTGTPTGGTTVAASCSRTDVQAAITAAPAGSRVTVPSGRCTWTSQIPLSKSLTIQGTGIDVTTIVSHGFDISTGVDDYRITGFTFDGAWGSNYIISHAQSRTGNKRFRIDHNKFLNKEYTTSGTLVFQGYSYGLIDHNVFQDTLDEILSFGGDGAPAYSRTPVVGGYENGTIFAEDNTFTLTSACSAHFGGDPNGAAENVFDANSAPRVVFRYNTISDSPTCRWMYPIEMHGFESEFSTVGDARPIYSVEIYNNTFVSNYNGSGMAVKIRGLGAGGVIFNNTFTGPGHSFATLANLRNLRSHTSDDTGSLSKGNLNSAGYTQLAHARQSGESALICEHCSGHTGLVFGQVQNLYIWGNVNAGPVTIESNGFVTTDILLNTHYFLSAMPGYTPYPYPHPLQGTP